MTHRTARQAMGALALGTFLASLPLAIDLGTFTLGPAPAAFAKDGGSGNSGSGGSGSSGSGGGGGRSDDSGGGRDDSGGGRDDNGGGRDSGGHGGDDHGGRGGDDSGGGRGGDDSGGGRGGDDGNRATGDDNGGSREDGDDRGGRGRGGDDVGSAGAAAGGGGLRVVRFEQGGRSVEVTYSNGVREEIEGGRLEVKDASGRTVTERPATAADLSRLRSNARNSGLAPVAATSRPARVEAAGGTIEVTYDTGWREEIEAGRYELKDPNNNTVVQRRATAADLRRLQALAGG